MLNQTEKNMKKSVLALAMAFGVTTAFAQDLTSSKGEKYLPEAGEWAISFDALPVIGTMGNLMNPNTNTTVTGTGGATNYIVGKMMKDEKTAYRVVLGLNFGSTTTKMNVSDDQPGVATPDPNKTVVDVRKEGSNSIALGGGIEMRRGSTRLQGYYGGMGIISFGGSKNTYTYGNAMTAATGNNPSPTFYDWSSGSVTSGSSRTTTNKMGTTIGLDLVGFIGAEYFVLPKLAIGAEYWWGIGFSTTGEGEMATEELNSTSGAVQTTTTKTAGGSAFNIGGTYGAQLKLTAYF